MTERNEKIFKNIDEQVEILKSKGLIINDLDKAKEALLRESYFFISGYRHFFMNKERTNKFIKGTTFEELYAMFNFDRKLRNIFFKNILIVENNLKTIISYQLSKKYGYKEKDYLDPSNFTQDKLSQRRVYDILNKMKRQIRINGKQHSATAHYIDNYGYIPMWILVKVLSFGVVSELYGILKREDQEIIADFFEITPEVLEIYLALLSNFRNICAHEDILYDHRTQRVIPDTLYHSILKIEKTNDEYNYGKNDVFALIIILKKLLTSDAFIDMINEISYEIDILKGKMKVIPIESILNKIGFPNNWEEIGRID